MITLTDDQVATIREALAAGGTRDEAAQSAGITRSILDRHMRSGGQLPDLRGGRRWRPRAVDPTPEEIASRAAALRARWSEERLLEAAGS